MAVYRGTKSGEGYRKLVDNGDRCPPDAGILWTRRRVYAVQWGVRSSPNAANEVQAAVQPVLVSAQERHEWPDKMPDRARPQVIPGDGKCLYWALSAVNVKDGQAAADQVRRALTEGDMARPLEPGRARRVMRDGGVRVWEQYVDKLPTGKIWAGACEVEWWGINEDVK